MTATIRRCVVRAILISAFEASIGSAQVPQALTRLTVGGEFSVSEPQGTFHQNVGTGFGAGGTLIYHLLRSGLLSFRFDAAGFQYGSEKKRVPFSETVGARVLLDVTTRNSIAALSWGPELAKPAGRLRPYINAGYSRLFFRTTSTVDLNDSSEDSTNPSTTNFKDGTGAWVYGGGVRVQLLPVTSAVMLDLGARFHQGGTASYLREGSIHDNPDGSITFDPLRSRTPFVAYTVGVKFRIPFNPAKHCGKFLC